MTKKQQRAKNLYDKALALSVELSSTINLLSSVASEIVGEDIIADLCHGMEVEFRKPDEPFTTYMRIEDVLSWKIMPMSSPLESPEQSEIHRG